METPDAKETHSFWKTYKELFISMVIISLLMFGLKYLFKIAVEFHLT